MKSGISNIASELAGLLIPVVLSAIVHTSVFLVNPTFNISLRDKSGDSNDRFLIVELRKQGSGVRGQRSVINNKQSVTVGKQSMAGSQKGKAKNKRSEDTAKRENIAKPAKARYKQPLKEVKVVVPQESSHPIPEKTATETSIAHSKIRGDENSYPQVNPIPSREGGQIRPESQSLLRQAQDERPRKGQSKGGFSGQTLLSGDHEESSSSQTSTEVAQVGPVQQVTGEPKTVADAANDTGGAETFLVSSNATEVQPSPGSVNKKLDEVKDREEERPGAHVDTNVADVVDIREEALNKVEDTSARNEIEAKKDETVETGAAEEKREDVVPGEIDSSNEEPAPFNETSMSPGSTTGDENPPLEGKGEGEDGHKTSSEQEIWQIAKAEVAEKVEEPATVVEQKAEAPPKKRPRSLPFHKMLEPEKEAMIGIRMGRPVVKITTPSKKRISSRVQAIGGRVAGNGIGRVVLSVNGEILTVPLQSGRFQWDAVLKEGKNVVTATVWDGEGYSAKDQIVVDVLPERNRFALFVDEPVSGEIESDVAIVKGSVADSTVETVKVIVNGEFSDAAVEEGRFEKTVLFKERENTLEVEAVNQAGLIARSGVVKVLVKDPTASDIQFHLLWDDMDVEPKISIIRKERFELSIEKTAGRGIGIVNLLSATEGRGEKIFGVEDASDGGYTVRITADKGIDCILVLTVNATDADRRNVRVFEKRLTEGEEWLVGRFIVPEGVFWDEDEWFSGRIEDKDSITKYRSPEGVTWKELKE